MDSAIEGFGCVFGRGLGSPVPTSHLRSHDSQGVEIPCRHDTGAHAVGFFWWGLCLETSPTTDPFYWYICFFLLIDPIKVNHIHVDCRQYRIVTWMDGGWYGSGCEIYTQNAAVLWVWKEGQWRELQVCVIPPGVESFAHLRKSNCTSTWRKIMTIHSWRYYFLGELDWFEGSIWSIEHKF